MDTNNSRAKDEQVELVRQILWLARKHFHMSTALLEETGIGGGQIPVLMELEKNGALNQRELAVNQAELELGVGNDDAARGSVVRCGIVDGQ